MAASHLAAADEQRIESEIWAIDRITSLLHASLLRGSARFARAWVCGMGAGSRTETPMKLKLNRHHS